LIHDDRRHASATWIGKDTKARFVAIAASQNLKGIGFPHDRPAIG
jgi:hypothetical protein